VVDYVEVWYNRQCLHSSLDYLSLAASALCTVRSYLSTVRKHGLSMFPALVDAFSKHALHAWLASNLNSYARHCQYV